MPILEKLVTAYKLWHGHWIHLNKLAKFGLGSKIESLFIETIQHLFIASRKPKEDKTLYLNRASDSFDILKFSLYLLWEMGSLDTKKYISLSSQLAEVGRMLGGWQKQTRTL